MCVYFSDFTSNFTIKFESEVYKKSKMSQPSAHSLFMDCSRAAAHPCTITHISTDGKVYPKYAFIFVKSGLLCARGLPFPIFLNAARAHFLSQLCQGPIVQGDCALTISRDLQVVRRNGYVTTNSVVTTLMGRAAAAPAKMSRVTDAIVRSGAMVT